VAPSEGLIERLARVRDLPGLRFSAALAAFARCEGGATGGAMGGASKVGELAAATEALGATLRGFPCFLRPLLAGAGVDTSLGAARSTAEDWPGLLNGAGPTAAASAASANLPFGAEASDQSAVLLHLAAAYRLRSAPFWKATPGALRWLFTTAAAVAAAEASSSGGGGGGGGVSALGPAAAARAEANRLFGPGSGAAKYRAVPLSELGDAYEQLPPDLPALDHGLLAPMQQRELARHAAALRRHHRGAGQRQPGGFGDLVGFGGGGFEDDPELIGALQASIGLGPAAEPLDPNAPLAQLFWQSALPWNHVDFLAHTGGE